MKIKLSELRQIVRSIIREQKEQMYLNESILPEDIVKKISPCMMTLGLENLDAYPKTAQIIMDMITNESLPNPFDPAILAAVKELASTKVNAASLMKFLNCVGKALQIQY